MKIVNLSVNITEHCSETGKGLWIVSTYLRLFTCKKQN